MSKVITDLLEATMHKYYLENYPVMVDGIAKLLTAGESKSKIKKYCERIVGKSMKSIYIGFMIDYVNKQVKN
jgi:hypothetical protein